MNNEKKRLFHDIVPPADPSEAETIYMIKNIIDGKAYVGRTKEYDIRIPAHMAKLKAGTHRNMLFQEAYDRDGPEAFKPSKVYTDLAHDDAAQLERDVIIIFNDRLYNLADGSGTNFSKHPLAEQMREELKTRFNTPEAKAKALEGIQRMYADPEARERRRQAVIEATNTDKFKTEHSQMSRDFWADPENKRMISEMMKQRHAERRAAMPPKPEKPLSELAMNRRARFQEDPEMFHNIVCKASARNKELHSQPICGGGKIYQSMGDAARDTGLNMATVAYRLKSGRFSDWYKISREKYKELMEGSNNE